MTRKLLICKLSEYLNKNESEIQDILKRIYEEYKVNCCLNLVEEAFDNCDLIEYRACRVFFEYLMKGDQ
jgi:hypothetical protein